MEVLVFKLVCCKKDEFKESISLNRILDLKKMVLHKTCLGQKIPSAYSQSIVSVGFFTTSQLTSCSCFTWQHPSKVQQVVM